MAECLTRRRLSKNSSHKKWPLLVRSLSDSAKYRRRFQPTEAKALTLSLSDSRLFGQNCNKFSKNQLDFFEKDDICSCGCDQDLEDVYSEDEGCFVITSVPQSNEEEEEEEEHQVTNKVRPSIFFRIYQERSERSERSDYNSTNG